MLANITITLVIPSFNRADLIIETIERALSQTRSFSEIIVVDDGSTDETLNRLERFRSSISVIPSRKVGVQMARNIGVSAAKSTYVTLCDSDDLLELNFVEVVSRWFAQHEECDSLYSNFVTFKGLVFDRDKLTMAPTSFFDGAVRDGEFISSIPDLYGKTVSFQPLFSSGVTVKKSFYELIKGYDPLFNGIGSEDWEYTLRAVQFGNTAICTLPLVKIRRHAGNDSRNKIRMLLGEVTVLEHAVRSHQAAARYRTLIDSSINARRIQAFELAFGFKNYDEALKILSSIVAKPKGLKFLIKQFVTKIFGKKINNN